MIKTLMTEIREFVTWGVTALPLKEKSHPGIEVTVKAVRFGIDYLDGRKSR
jgi:hypothetical protein